MCDPLPDPSNERDLTTFITIWKEGRDKTLQECSLNCQISEDVIRQMQNILGEALSNYNNEKVEWCNKYTKEMRDIVLKKFDCISAHILEYVENFTKFTPEEIEKQKNNPNTRKNDSNVRPEFSIVNATKDVRLAVYGNVAGKAQMHKYVEFGGIACKTPRQF